MLQSRRLYQAIGIVGATLCLTVSLILLMPRLLLWSVLPDFTVFWTAARMALDDAPKVYDTIALTGQQAWAVDPSRGPRPFPYPPTTLLFLIPFGLLPFWAAYWSWLALSALAFWSAVRRVATGWAVPLALCTPHVILVLILGQTTLIVASLIIWCLSLVEKRPRLAGVLAGIAAALKPQSVLLVPVALASGRHWRALGFFLGSLSAVVIASFVLGPSAWGEWVGALGSFREAIEWHDLYKLGATPSMAGHVLGLAPIAMLLLQFAAVIAGTAAVWHAFKTDDLKLRLAALVIGSLLASPYGMRYDLAALAPVLTMGLLSGTLQGLLISAPLFALHSLTILPALMVSLIASLDQQRRARVPR